MLGLKRDNSVIGQNLKPLNITCNYLYAQFKLAVLCVLNSRFQSISYKISIIPYHP